MDHAGFKTQKAFVDALDNIVTQQNISVLLNGNSSGSEFTVQFALACGVRCEWLATEQGEMIENRAYAKDDFEVAALKVMQTIPSYAKPEAIKSLDTIKKLTGGPEDSKPESASQ